MLTAREEQDMSKEVKIRDLVIGAGVPKICIPVMGTTIEEIENEVQKLVEHPFDLVEWRADYFAQVKEQEQVEAALQMLRRHLGNIPLLFTLRTKREGGECEVTFEEYILINTGVIATGLADIVDVQTGLGDDIAFVIIESAHVAGVKVLTSRHYFGETPKKEELIMRLCKMQDLEADIVKIAVMPKSERDVLTLLDATLAMKELHNETPVVTMAMGEIGVISRIVGKTFGSAITFGCAAKASAPGQIAARDLKEILIKI